MDAGSLGLVLSVLVIAWGAISLARAEGHDQADLVADDAGTVTAGDSEAQDDPEPGKRPARPAPVGRILLGTIAASLVVVVASAPPCFDQLSECVEGGNPGVFAVALLVLTGAVLAAVLLGLVRLFLRG